MSDRGIDVSRLSPLEQTALLTQYARALDSRWPRPILGDVLAEEIVHKIDYDFAGLGVPASVVCQSALRAKMLDDRVRGRIGWFSRVAVKLAPQQMFTQVGAQWGYPGFKDARVPETWNPRLTLVEETSLAHAAEVELFPGWIRLATKVSGQFKASARKARILRYRF